MSNKITAYDLVKSINDLKIFLEQNTIYMYIGKVSVLDVYKQYCDFYFNQEFFINNIFYPKKELNEYEIDLFMHHPATIFNNKTEIIFKGYKLIDNGK
jgi:hypothetical protein